jgi:hypothetical protein
MKDIEATGTIDLHESGVLTDAVEAQKAKILAG